MLALALLASLAAAHPTGPATPRPAAVGAIVETYVERYFRTFPTRATEAGRHDLDRELEDLAPDAVARWIQVNRDTRSALAAALAATDLGAEDRLDAEVLLAQVERELHDLATVERPRRDPLFWSGLLASATVFLLVRDDRPLGDRVEAARLRARQLPRLAGQARVALEAVPPSRIAPELCQVAAGQLRASARFYRDGFPRARGETDPSLAEAGGTAAAALDELADWLEGLAERATGSPRLGAAYASAFRHGTGVQEPVAAVLASAERDLAAKRVEAAAFGRSVWHELLPTEPAPGDDRAVLRRLFARVAEDRDRALDEYVESWRRNTRDLERFVRERRLMSLPDPLTLEIAESPAFFVGQSVGGVYPAGPYAPEAKTLLFLPVPPASASETARDAFFRDFNRHFNLMIAAHELIPGHYVQLKLAARHPRTLRALFPDPVYVEGWGTFAERVTLDQGWGGPLPRLAHLKKQLENIARAIVDIRVHTSGMTRDEVLRFARDDALQDDQFAANMWMRAITTSPQLTTYYLGYREVTEVFEAARQSKGTAFSLRAFLDGMMELGPVPLRHYRQRLARGVPPAGPVPRPWPAVSAP